MMIMIGLLRGTTERLFNGFMSDSVDCVCLTSRGRITTCAGGNALTRGTDGLLTPFSCLLKLAVSATRAVSVTVRKK